MDKKKELESLHHELFKDLPEERLSRVAGGILATTGGKPGATNVGKIHDEEFST
jgi:hypothetical protein